MHEERQLYRLVELAQQGQEDSMSQLAHEAKGKLRAYVYRITLDNDLAYDLSQETLLQMFKSLDCLSKVKRFWPWLYRIAQGKIQDYYTAKQRKTLILESAFYRDFLSQNSGYHQDDGLRQLLHEELSKKVMTAMAQIKQQYRAMSWCVMRIVYYARCGT